jgi:hypothetical protein
MIRRAAPAALLVAYLLLAFLLFAGAWRHPLSQSIGNSGDTRQFIWFFSWPAFALGHHLNPFYADSILWPAGANLMWNTSVLLPATILSPVTAFAGPVLSYNLYLTLAPALSAWSAYLFIRRFVPAMIPSAVGGLVYGFSPFIAAQSLGHAMLTMAALPPLIFLVIDGIVRRDRSPIVWGMVLGALAAAQLLISEEVLAMTALVAAIALAVLAAEGWNEVRTRLSTAILGAASALLTFIVLAGYPLAIQFFGRQRLSGALHPPNLFVNDLLGFVVPSRNQLLAPHLATALSDRFVAAHVLENASYLGIPLLLLLGFIALRGWSDIRVRIATLTGVVLAILSLGYSLHVAGHNSRVPVVVLALMFPVLHRLLPWRVLLVLTAAGWIALDRLPLLHQLLPSRLGLFLFLCAGLGVAVFLEWLPGLERGRPVAAAALILALLAILPAAPFPRRDATVPTFFSGPGVETIPQDAVALVAPYAALHHEEPMLWQAVARQRYRMPEGYAFAPNGDGNDLSGPATFTRNLLWAIEAGTHDGSLSDTERGELMADLDRWQVRFVIVGPMSHEDQAVALFSKYFGQAPRQVGGVYLWGQ